MPTVRIDEEVWRELQKRARPFEDSPNDVMREVLGLDAEDQRRSGRSPLGCTPQSAYWLPLLKVLEEMGGEGRMHDVLDRLGNEMKEILRPVDHEKNATGVVRYREGAMWARHAMVQEGLLKSDSPRGLWEISEKGRARLHRTKHDPTPGEARAEKRAQLTKDARRRAVPGRQDESEEPDYV